jgi:hypothetical protein
MQVARRREARHYGRRDLVGGDENSGVAHWAATSASKMMLALANAIVDIGDLPAGGTAVLIAFRDSLKVSDIASKL